MQRSIVRYFTIAPGDEYSLGMTEDGRYVYAGHFGSTQMTELYDIGSELYEKFTETVDEEKIHKLIQDMFVNCKCIAFKGSQTEPLPVKVPEYKALENLMKYSAFIAEHHVISGRLEGGKVILSTADGKETYFELKDQRSILWNLLQLSALTVQVI